MKYRVNKPNTFDIDVIVEDGGIACIYESDGGITTMYYQTRLTDIDQSQDIFDQLGEGKAYIKEWGLQHPDMDELIKDALEWLVVGETEWERDDTIFSNISI